MAAAALAGIDPMLFVRVEDELELTLLRRVARKAIELHGLYRQDQADRTIGALDKGLKRGNAKNKSSSNTTSSTR